MTRDNNIPEIDFVITWVDGNDPDWQKRENGVQYAAGSVAETG